MFYSAGGLKPDQESVYIVFSMYSIAVASYKSVMYGSGAASYLVSILPISSIWYLIIV